MTPPPAGAIVEFSNFPNRRTPRRSRSVCCPRRVRRRPLAGAVETLAERAQSAGGVPKHRATPCSRRASGRKFEIAALSGCSGAALATTSRASRVSHRRRGPIKSVPIAVRCAVCDGLTRWWSTWYCRPPQNQSRNHWGMPWPPTMLRVGGHLQLPKAVLNVQPRDARQE